MHPLLRSLLALAALLIMAPTVGAQTVHEVRMVDKSMTEFAFEPAHITVKPGDVVTWINAGTLGQPHNVDFRTRQGGLGGSGIVGTVSPFLTTQGETWSVTIDDRFEVGEQPYVCTPHEFMGMTGTITVEAPGNPEG